MPLVDKNKTSQVPTILIFENENKSVIITAHKFVIGIKRGVGGNGRFERKLLGAPESYYIEKGESDD